LAGVTVYNTWLADEPSQATPVTDSGAWQLSPLLGVELQLGGLATRLDGIGQAVGGLWGSVDMMRQQLDTELESISGAIGRLALIRP
ncbi:MAG: hypothetical protein V1757_05245, partial [Actinomycetota bacterium]